MNPFPQPVHYKPIGERAPDRAQQNLMKEIMRRGRKGYAPFQKEETRMLTMEVMRFNMSDGFPLTTLRSMKSGFKSSLAEIIAFINGARTLDEYVSFGGDPKWWDKWVTAEKCQTFGLQPGDFGRGSYGPSLTHRLRDGERLNQVEMVIQQMKDFPGIRTHALTTWYPEFDLQTKEKKREVVVAPCHGTFVHFITFPETKELHVNHLQRSGDVPVGVTFNIVQYAALGMMFAHLLGYKLTGYEHAISDGHIYESQFPSVEELLTREPKRLPTVTINTDVKSIFDFRPEHFTLDDYEAHPAMKIPTPI